MDFATAYSRDVDLWTSRPAPPPPRKLQKLPENPIPVEDPHGLSGLMTQEEIHSLDLNNQYRLAWIDITNPEDREKLREIYQRVTDHWYSIMGEETFVIDGRTMKLLRYVEQTYTIPPWLTEQLTTR